MTYTLQQLNTKESTCNTSIESYQNEKDLEAVYVWDYIVKDNLNELIDTTYTNKMHLFPVAHHLRTS